MQEMKKTETRPIETGRNQQFPIVRSNVLNSLQKPIECTNYVSQCTDRNSNVLSMQQVADLQYEPRKRDGREVPYREAVCELCEKTVSLALDVPLSGLQANTRCNAETALARQIAMYLSHTTFSLLLTEVGLHFGRDRSTVGHACAVVEDKRDDLAFDVLICQLESLLSDARNAMGICYEEGEVGEAPANRRVTNGLGIYEQKMLKGEL